MLIELGETSIMRRTLRRNPLRMQMKRVPVSLKNAWTEPCGLADEGILGGIGGDCCSTTTSRRTIGGDQAQKHFLNEHCGTIADASDLSDPE